MLPCCFSLSQTYGFIFDAVPAGLGDDKVVSPRLDRLARLGELITQTLAASKRFAAKFFTSSGSQEPTEFIDVPAILEQATKLHKSSLKSAARGGAKTALGLFMAHYPEAEIEAVTEGMPSTYEDGSEVEPAVVLDSVAGYATRVADMVDTSIFYRRHLLPAAGEAGAAGTAEAEGSDSSGAEVVSPQA